MAHDQWCEAQLVPPAWNTAGLCHCRLRELSAEVAALRELLRDAASALQAAIREEQTAFDSPPEPASQWDYEAGQLVAAITAALDTNAKS